MKPILILTQNQMSSFDIETLRNNGLCVAILNDLQPRKPVQKSVKAKNTAEKKKHFISPEGLAKIKAAQHLRWKKFHAIKK